MKITKVDRRSKLEKEMDEVLSVLSELEAGTQEYDKVLNEYEKLVILNDKIVSKKKISPDAKAGIIANALGIGIVLWHEKAHVIATKAWNMVIRGRL